MREQTSNLSLGGCYVKTIATIPVGTKLGLSLWLGEDKVTISAMVVTCHPEVGNGIQFPAMLPQDRNRVRSFLESDGFQTSPAGSPDTTSRSRLHTEIHAGDEKQKVTITNAGAILA